MNNSSNTDAIVELVSTLIVIAFFGSIIYIIINYSLFIIGLTLLGLGLLFTVGMLIYAKNCKGHGCFNGIFLLPGIAIIIISIFLIVIGYFIK